MRCGDVSLLGLLSRWVWGLLWAFGVCFPLLAANVGGCSQVWRFVVWGWYGWEWDLCVGLDWVCMGLDWASVSCGVCLWGVLRCGVLSLCSVGTVLRGRDLVCMVSGVDLLYLVERVCVSCWV